MSLGLLLLALAGGRPEARAQVPLAGPVEVILDASEGMLGRLGDANRMTAAKEFVRTLRVGLGGGGTPPPVSLRVYGAGTPRARRDCTDTRLLTRASDPPEALEQDLNAIGPLGVAPLARTLREAAADSAGVFVLVAHGGDTCSEDPCPVWRETIAGRTGPRPRLHVVAIDPEPDELDGLRCLSRASSGSFTTIAGADEAAPAAQRVALILRNEGLLDVRLAVGPDAFTAPVRLSRPLTGEIVTAFVSRAPRAVPAGMYTVMLETAPPISLERVLVLPGERVTIGYSDFGRLEVVFHDPRGGGARAPVSIRSSRGGPELRYVQTGQPVVLRAGAYDVQTDLGDSLAIREGVAVSPGRTTRIVLGSSAPGTLTILTPEFAAPPPTRALLYREGRVDTLAVGRPGALAPGVYRLVVQTLPPYVAEGIRIESEREATVALPATAVLGVDLIGPEGPIRGVRVHLREPLTGELYGTIPSGERRLLMPGIFDLEIAAAPPFTVVGVTLAPGEERTIERAGLSAVTLDAPAAGRVRLEVWTDTGARRLAEATGAQPVVAARPGTYIARVSRAGEPLWQGRILVAPGKAARIHLPGP